MPQEIWLIRHGETEWSKSGQHTGRTDLALTAEGEARAKTLGEAIRGRAFARILSSPLQRARETCRIAGYEPEIVDDLREWDYGDFEGLTTPQIQQRVPGWSVWTHAVTGGETAEQVGARADRVIERVTGIKGNVALFGHGHMLRILAARWIGMEARGGRLLALSTASLSTLGYERDSRVILLWNRTGA